MRTRLLESMPSRALVKEIAIRESYWNSTQGKTDTMPESEALYLHQLQEERSLRGFRYRPTLDQMLAEMHAMMSGGSPRGVLDFKPPTVVLSSPLGFVGGLFSFDEIPFPVD